MNFDLDKMYCGAIRRGDIFLVDKDGREVAVVVLQDNVLNEGLPTVVCAKIVPYRKSEEVLVNEILLKKNETGLGKDGICMLHKILTVDRRNMVAKKGELKFDRLQEVFKKLDVTLGRFRDRIVYQ